MFRSEKLAIPLFLLDLSPELVLNLNLTSPVTAPQRAQPVGPRTEPARRLRRAAPRMPLARSGPAHAACKEPQNGYAAARFAAAVFGLGSTCKVFNLPWTIAAVLFGAVRCRAIAPDNSKS